MKKITMIIAIMMFTVNIFAQHNRNNREQNEHNNQNQKCRPLGLPFQQVVYTANYGGGYGHHHHQDYYQEYNEHSNCNRPHYEEPVCIRPMSAEEFEYAKQSVACKYFDDTRLIMAKQIVSSNRLLSWQVRELMETMSFETTRLSLAKYAWNHVFDPQNYYKLNDAFVFESSIDELQRFTEYN